MSPAPSRASASSSLLLSARRDVLRALAQPGSERADELLACCLQVAGHLGLDDHERVVLGRAAQLHALGVPTEDVTPPDLDVAARVARRVLDRWDATRTRHVPRVCSILAACAAHVDGASVHQLRRAAELDPQVIDALEAVTAVEP